MTGPKLVLLGVDAADSRVVRQWAGEGLLPTFADLLGSGVVAPVETPVAVLEGGIWPTLLTSTSPATHGMFGKPEPEAWYVRRRAGDVRRPATGVAVLGPT